MRPYAKPQTKRQERRLMQTLMERRERKTPEHHSPEWLYRFWKGLAS
jgi:hypothetical protein